MSIQPLMDVRRMATFRTFNLISSPSLNSERIGD